MVEGASGPLLVGILWQQLNRTMQLVASPFLMAENAGVNLAGSQEAGEGQLVAVFKHAGEQQGNKLRDEVLPLGTLDIVCSHIASLQGRRYAPCFCEDSLASVAN